jgi:pimeloyl-ACP methyl ester carboxylesterase
MTAPSQNTPRQIEPAHDRVILIHGLGRSPLSMMRLQWTLRRAGYQVSNLRYPSRRADCFQVAFSRLDAIINQSHSGKIHFVTHSLGGIIVRQYLAGREIPNLGRVVMLAPPNHGSELADHLRNNPLGRWITGPIGRQMGTTPGDLSAQLGPARFQVGVIAADGPGFPWYPGVFQAPNDGIVSVESAKLDGMTDFLVVRGSHTFIMWRRETARQVQSFLREGRFTPLPR